MSAALLGSDLELAAEVLEIEPDLKARIVDDNTAAARFVTFFYGDNLYGLRAEEVAEVTHLLPISPLPNSPESLCGIAPLRGEIVAVVDVRKLLREISGTLETRSKFVILRAAPNETPIAFKVDRMHELVAADDASYVPVDEAGSILDGVANIEGRAIGVISGEALRSALGS